MISLINGGKFVNGIFIPHEKEEFKNSPLMITAKEGIWDKETLDQLRTECNVFFDPKGVRPIMIQNDAVYIGNEDDGTIYFERYWYKLKNGFNVDYIPILVENLMEVLYEHILRKEYQEEKKKSAED